MTNSSGIDAMVPNRCGLREVSIIACSVSGYGAGKLSDILGDFA